MIEPIFEGARATCWRHPNVNLMPDEAECDICKIIRRNLSLTPPFQVLCTRTHFSVKEGKEYQVVWVIRDGAKQHNDATMGYVFRDTEGHLVDQVYDPLAFIPVKFLEKEDKTPEAREPQEWMVG